VLTTWRHAPGHDVSRRGTSCVRTGLLPVIPGSQHQAHPLPGLGLDYSPPSSREHPILPPIFLELRYIRTPLLSSSLSARRRKKEVPLHEERYRWPPRYPGTLFGVGAALQAQSLLQSSEGGRHSLRGGGEEVLRSAVVVH
jgi:hypothetical protein